MSAISGVRLLDGLPEGLLYLRRQRPLVSREDALVGEEDSSYASAKSKVGAWTSRFFKSGVKLWGRNAHAMSPVFGFDSFSRDLQTSLSPYQPDNIAMQPRRKVAITV